MKIDSEDDRKNLIMALKAVPISGTPEIAFENSKIILELVDKIATCAIEKQGDKCDET